MKSPVEFSLMHPNVESQIEVAEEKLRLAMLAADTGTLDALISPDLVFTTHFGSVISKQDDLGAYRSGALKFRAIEPSERRMLVLDQVVYVSVRMRLSGVFGDTPFDDDIRFSRVWTRAPHGAWQISGGQATAVQVL